jgi:hypothetical protein
LHRSECSSGPKTVISQSIDLCFAEVGSVFGGRTTKELDASEKNIEIQRFKNFLPSEK